MRGRQLSRDGADSKVAGLLFCHKCQPPCVLHLRSLDKVLKGLADGLEG